MMVKSPSRLIHRGSPRIRFPRGISRASSVSRGGRRRAAVVSMSALGVLLVLLKYWNEGSSDLLSLGGMVELSAGVTPSAYNALRIQNAGSGVACRYHGNCPVGEVCTANGVCLPYHQQGTVNVTSNEVKLQQCVQMCLKELTIEERFQYESIPDVVSRSDALAPHSGCVISYHRRKTQGVWTDRPSDEYRRAQRWRSVVRIDPVIDKPGQWMALCRHTCETDADCERGLACLGRKIYDESRPQGAEDWTFSKTCQIPREPIRDMVVVSGANTVYFPALRNLAASVRFWAPKYKLAVFNLGMSPDELTTVKSWPNLDKLYWEDGFPSSFPEHIRSDQLTNYAWKSAAVNESVHDYGAILWHDAGSTFTGPVDQIEEILYQHGTFLCKGQDAHMSPKAHPGAYTWFGYDKDTYETGPHYSGNIQGFVYPSRYIDSLVIPNTICGFNASCISPPGSSLQDHRYDQTSLSILAYQPHIQAPEHTEYLAAERRQLQSNLSTSSYPMLLWTSRGGCSHYSDLLKF